MKINKHFFLLALFFCVFLSAIEADKAFAQSTAQINVPPELCSKYGKCDPSCWTWTGQSQVGVCTGNNGVCCVRSDQAQADLMREYVMTPAYSGITDPDLQRQALAGTLAGATLPSQNTSFGTMRYTLLEKVPGTDNVGSDLKSYLEALYRLALILVTLSAVLMISIGGFMYLTSAGNTSQVSTAKGIISDALIGLVIALAAWLVLYVINPDLSNPTLPGVNPAVSTGVNLGGTGGVTPPPGTGTPGTCGGLTPQANIKCEDASPKLSDILACIKGKGVTASVSSIGDSAGFDTCKNNWTDPKCAHKQFSCHYGGGSVKTAPECQKSHAADISIKNGSGRYDQSIANAVMTAAKECGARVKDETNIPGVAPHVHISAPTTCCSL